MAETKNEATPVATAVAVESFTKEQALAKFGQPPAGKTYRAKEGKIVLGPDGKPVLWNKKASTGRNKPKKPVFPIPTGKLQSSETPGFDITSHARLKVTDFHDPLDHAKWEVWFYQQHVTRAQSNVTNIAALGNTAEERKAAGDQNRLATALENLTKRVATSGNAQAKSALMDRIGKIYAELKSA